MAGTFNTIHLIRQVDLFTLKLFLTVVEEGQVGRAAARENIAASAATKRIQDLEEIVGAQLFERNPRGVVPTAAGLVFARHVSGIFGTFEDIRRDFAEFTEGVRGTIRVCSTGGIISLYLAREIAEFARGFPLVDIDLREGINNEVVRALAAGEVDVAVFVDAPGTPGLDEIETQPYRVDRLMAVVARGHALAEREHVKVTELLEHNLIGIAPSTNLMGLVRKAAADAGVEFTPKYNVNSVYAAAGLVRVNQGVTIQPENMLSAKDLDWVTTVPLDEPWAQRRLMVGTKRGRSLTVAARNFAAQLLARMP
ncbi:LysR family transcriptional regulator [Pseudorhodoferax sp.]|uniref:LysR family transcriptional regulator n=1 Tax=Pseudorhodoferax sp. TaxID=1993553 RepID=UPI002DD62A5C|nr:LysR family transcriptional regulator [Pseudorhodoferax sp.]